MNDTTQGSPLRFGGAAQQGDQTNPNLDKTAGTGEPEPRNPAESEVGVHSRPNILSPADANANQGDPAHNVNAPGQPQTGVGRGQPGGESSAQANARMAEGLVAFEVAAGNDLTGDEPPKFLYSSKPIERFQLGRFTFQDGYLGFYEESDAAEFEELVRQQPTYTVVNIRRLAGAAPVKRAPAFNKGVDTTANTTDGRGDGVSV